MTQKVVSFVAKSGTGKTTLLGKVIGHVADCIEERFLK